MPPAELPAIMSRLASNSVPWGSVFTDKMLTMTWTAADGWTAPQIVAHAALPFAPSSSIFHYGMAVFEGLKAYRTPSCPPRLFRPDLNIARLNRSARRIALPQLDPAVLLAALCDFVAAQEEWVPTVPGASLYLRPTLIATDPRIGVRRSDSAMLFVIASPVASFFPSTPGGPGLQPGVDLLADPTYVRAWKGGVGACKTGGNYAASIAPAEEAKERGFDQILWLSDAEKRFITEVGMMNVFFVVKDGEHGSRLITPQLNGTILDGVTRRSVLELAEEMDVPSEERDIPIDEIYKAAENGNLLEVFGSGTAAIVCPVRSITWDGRKVQVKEREAEGDLSFKFRERLIAIQGSSEPHKWMVPVSSKEEKVESVREAVAVYDFEKNKNSDVPAAV